MVVEKESLSYKLLKVCSQIQQFTRKKFRIRGITEDNYFTMYYISENPGITQVQLADLNQKDKNVISKVIKRLEKKNFVHRERGEDDKRSFRLYLTDSGSEAMNKYWNVMTKSEKKRLQRLTPEEQKVFLDMLTKLLD